MSPGIGTGSDELGLDDLNWHPVSIQFTSKDEDFTQHLILLIVMPSGVASKDLSGINMAVEDDGRDFHMTITVPELLTNVGSLYELLRRKWNHDELNDELHAVSLSDGIRIKNALEEHLAVLRTRESESLVCDAHFPLGIRVSKKINNIHLLGEMQNHTRILYIDLKGEESEYKMKADVTVSF